MFIRFDSPGTISKDVAVVFVHGFTGDCRGTWGNIPELLAKNQALAGWDLLSFGYDSKRSIDFLHLWSSDASLEEISTMLTSLPDLKNYRRIAFVAHSMGGLVVQRALLKDSELRAQTSHVVLFGTPSDGLGKARPFAALKQQAADMDAAGPFIAQLRADWTALKLDDPPFRFLAVAGEKDQFVPPSSSIYPFAQKFQAVIPGDHLTMLKTDVETPAPVVKMITDVLTRGAALLGPRNSAALAVERGDFQQAIDKLLPIHQDLDNGGAALLALALDAMNRREEAISVLRDRGENNSDALGVLAGRYKRRWILEHRQSDLDNAMGLYRKGYTITSDKTHYDADQAFYHGINLAFLNLATNQRAEAKSLAAAVLDHCADPNTNPKDIFWRLATVGDAYTILGQKENSLAKHQEAARLPMNPWQALSIEEQAVRIADLCGWSNDEKNKLRDLYLPH